MGVLAHDGNRGGGFLQSIAEQGYHERRPLYPVNLKLTRSTGSRRIPRSWRLDPVDHVISQIPAG
ncbi:MAG: hypothetical protein U0360_05765 [Dehalococcoidia bacterium]